jgi:hypothetical protein
VSFSSGFLGVIFVRRKSARLKNKPTETQL